MHFDMDMHFSSFYIFVFPCRPQPIITDLDNDGINGNINYYKPTMYIINYKPTNLQCRPFPTALHIYTVYPPLNLVVGTL